MKNLKVSIFILAIGLICSGLALNEQNKQIKNLRERIDSLAYKNGYSYLFEDHIGEGYYKTHNPDFLIPMIYSWVSGG